MSKQKVEGGKQRNVTEVKAKPEKERKTKYHSHILPYLGAISAMMRSGATMEILSQKFDVAIPTLYIYRERHIEFYNAIKTNADIADFSVENALYQNALAGNMVAQIFWLKNRQSKRWRDKQHVFQASSTTVRKDYEHMTDDELEREMDMLEGVVPDMDIESEGDVH